MPLKIANLNVYMENNHILQDVNLEIKDGEFFCLLGPSGCGKSTLLKTIAGLVQEKTGEIANGDKKLHCLPPQKRGVVIMFQDRRLFGNMTVGENVAFALRNKGVKKAERIKIADKYLEQVQLSEFAERRVHELSGGQQQRVALARALAAEPDVLMLDEPFSALDKNLRNAMRSLVKHIHNEIGVTTIMVTHDQNEALSISDRIAVISNGRVLQVGTPQEVFSAPACTEVAEYFSSESVLHGTVAGGIFTSGDISFKSTLPDGSAAAIIRKDNVAFEEGGDIPFVVDSVDYLGFSNSAVLSHGPITLRIDVPLNTEYEPGQTIGARVDWNSIIQFSEQ